MNIKTTIAICALFSTGYTNAQTIDFDALESSFQGGVFVGSTYIEDNFLVKNNSSSSSTSFLTWGQGSGLYPGSASLFNNVHRGETEITNISGLIFTAESIDLTPTFLSQGYLSPIQAESVTFFGTKSDGVSQVSQTFTMSGFNIQKNTYSFDSTFQNIISLSWKQGPITGVRHQFDNIILLPAVPEPSMAILLVAGLALMFSAKRGSKSHS